jgi:protein ImuA
MPRDSLSPATDTPLPFSRAPGDGPRGTRQDRIAALRDHIDRIERNGWAEEDSAIPLGVTEIDSHLPAGGLIAGGLYEIVPAAPGDTGAATAFCTVLAARLLGEQAKSGGNAVLWCLNPAVTDAGEIYPPAVARCGINPSHLVALRTRDDATTLQALEDALMSGAAAAVIGEVGTASLTASRRLQLAAATTGTPAILLRPSSAADTASAALMRWRIASIPSQPGGWADMLDEPGFPCWQAALFRCRGGAPGDWKVEWRDETGDLSLAASLRDRTAAPRSAIA